MDEGPDTISDQSDVDDNTAALADAIKEQAAQGDKEAAKALKKLDKLERKRHKVLHKLTRDKAKNKVGKREQREHQKAGLRKLSFGFGLVSYDERKRIIKDALNA